MVNQERWNTDSRLIRRMSHVRSSHPSQTCHCSFAPHITPSEAEKSGVSNLRANLVSCVNQLSRGYDALIDQANLPLCLTAQHEARGPQTVWHRTSQIIVTRMHRTRRDLNTYTLAIFTSLASACYRRCEADGWPKQPFLVLLLRH